MQKHIFIFVFVMFSIGGASAQNKWLNGYIILLTNDTLKGVINEAVLSESVNEIYFKVQSESRTAQKFAPNNILGFGLIDTNIHFVAHQVDVDTKAVPPNKVDISPFPRYSRSYAFLKKLVVGQANLLYYKDDNLKEHYFICLRDIIKKSQSVNYSKEIHGMISGQPYVQTINLQVISPLSISAGAPFELLHVFYEKNEGEIGERHLYRLQLDPIFKGCLTQKLDTLQFTEGSLKSVFDEYNKCYAVKYNHEFVELKNHLELTVWGGGSLGRASMTGFTGIAPIVAQNVKAINYTDALIPTLGVSLKFAPRKFPRYVFLNFDLFYLRHHFKAAETISETYKYDTHISLSYINFTPSVGFTLGNKLKPYLKIGGNLTLVSNLSSILTLDRTWGGVTTQSEDRPFKKSGTFAAGLTACVGVQRGRYSFETRYDYSSFKGLYNGLYVTGQDIKLLFGYRFFQQSRSLNDDIKASKKRMDRQARDR